MSADVIKEFLVGLGYKIDETGQRRFVDGVNNATDTVHKLSTALKALATGAAIYGVVHWFDKVTGSMEGMYYAAQRAGSSVKELQSFTYAASQMGSSASQALSNAQAIYQFFRNQPNAPNWLQSHLGVNALDARGKLKSGVQLAEEIGAALNKQPLYLQAQYAEQTQMPLELRMALQRAAQFKQFQNQYEAMLRRAGLNPDQAAEQARNFQRGARGIGAAFDIVKNAVMGSLTGHNGATGALGRFRDMILSHVPQITRILNRLADAGVTAFGKFLDWLDTVDWNKVFKSIGDFFDWLLSLDPKQITGYLKDIAAVLGVIFGLKMLAGIASFAGAITGLTPTLTGFAGALTTVATAIGGAASAALAGITALLYSKGLGGAQRPDGTYEDEALSAAQLAEAANDPRTKAWLRQQMGQAGPTATPSNKQAYLKALEKQYGLPDGLLSSVYQAESSGGKNLVSSKGALGPFQFLPSTAKAYGITNPMDFAQSAQGAAQMYADLLRANGFNLERALAAYNWGQGNLNRAGLQGAPAETRNYIRKIEAMMGFAYGSEFSGAAPAHQARPTSGPSLSAKTDIHVHGSTNPLATAQAVANKQADVNQRLVRNFRQVFA